MPTTTLTIPANVHEFVVALDGAGTYIAAVRDTGNLRLSRLQGVLGVGNHKLPVLSQGAPYGVRFTTDGTFNAVQPLTGAAVSKKRPGVVETWVANAPTFDTTRQAYKLVEGPAHEMRLTLQDRRDGTTLLVASSVQIAVEGEGLDVFNTDGTTRLSSKALVAGVLDLHLKPAKGFRGAVLVLTVTDSETGLRTEQRLAFVSDDDTSGRWLPASGFFPEVFSLDIVPGATNKIGYKAKGDWTFLDIRVFADGTPSSVLGTITLNVLKGGVTLLTAPLNLEQNLSGVVACSISNGAVNHADLVTFEVVSSNVDATGPKFMTITVELQAR